MFKSSPAVCPGAVSGQKLNTFCSAAIFISIGFSRYRGLVLLAVLTADTDSITFLKSQERPSLKAEKEDSPLSSARHGQIVKRKCTEPLKIRGQG
jgi:zona occludens toxin (predicted ATPase)